MLCLHLQQQTKDLKTFFSCYERVIQYRAATSLCKSVCMLKRVYVLALQTLRECLSACASQHAVVLIACHWSEPVHCNFLLKANNATIHTSLSNPLRVCVCVCVWWVFVLPSLHLLKSVLLFNLFVSHFFLFLFLLRSLLLLSAPYLFFRPFLHRTAVFDV